MRLGPLCLVVAVVVVLALPGAAAAARTPLTVSPAPGTPDASPKTGISVLGVPAGRIASVRVVGASSGLHRGRIAPFSRNRGGIFVPDAPLTEGERVTVVVRVRGRSPDRFSFVVARPDDAAVLSPTRSSPTSSSTSPPSPASPRRDHRAQALLRLQRRSSSRRCPRRSCTPARPDRDPHAGGPGRPDDRRRPGPLVWFHQLHLPEVAGEPAHPALRGQPVLTGGRARSPRPRTASARA